MGKSCFYTMLARVSRVASRAAPLRALGTKAAAGKPLPSGTLAAVHPRPGSEGRRLQESQAGREQSTHVFRRPANEPPLSCARCSLVPRAPRLVYR